MKIILTGDVERLGKEGEIVDVKDGYARNYLIPQGFAMISNKSNLRIYEEKKRVAERKDAGDVLKAEAVKSRIEALSITISMEAGENDRLFGSVTSGLISEALKKEGFKIDHRSVLIEEPIKELGVYTVAIRLHAKVHANLKVWVVSKEEP